MEISFCQNCGKAIFLGPGEEPRKRYAKYDDSWKIIVWRHMNTNNHACELKFAEPVGR